MDKNRADGHTGTGPPVTPAYRRETKPVCPAVKQCPQSHDHCAFRRMVVFYSFFFFQVDLFVWPHCTACGILLPRPGIKPVSPAVEAQHPNHWTAREVPVLSY